MRCQNLKMLGITLANDFAVTEHVQDLAAGAPEPRGQRGQLPAEKCPFAM